MNTIIMVLLSLLLCIIKAWGMDGDTITSVNEAVLFNRSIDELPIVFADAKVKAICVANWDTNYDGELSVKEAAAVTAIGTLFKDNDAISSFDELKYFTGIKELGDMAFSNCRNTTGQQRKRIERCNG